MRNTDDSIWRERERELFDVKMDDFMLFSQFHFACDLYGMVGFFGEREVKQKRPKDRVRERDG